MKNKKKKLLIISIILLLIIVTLLLLSSGKEKENKEIDNKETQIQDKSEITENNTINDNQETIQKEEQEIVEEISKPKKEENKEEQKPIHTDTKPKQEEGENKPKGHYEIIEEIIPAYDEQVLVKSAWDEKILIKEAYTEEKPYCAIWGKDTYYAYVCSQCGFTTEDSGVIQQHIHDSENCGSFSGQEIETGEAYCKQEAIEYIDHPAEYETIHHEAEYKIVHHKQEVKQKKIWVED